ncbi:MAG TPA: iron-containing alcohol dehydrogenase [Burkholderiales bacterium]|nr:iron-containing alcohol dehydrogenase [Burkholderiales bacterium]
MQTGVVQWTAQERVVHGKPAAKAVPEEMERIGAKRVLLLTTRSLADSRLVNAVSSALGDRCVGRFSDIHAHSPREAVIAGARLARETDADHLLAVGGGSVTDATKTMLVALWRGATDVDALSALALRRGSPGLTVQDTDRIRMTAVPTTLSAAEFTASAGVTDMQQRVKLSFSHPKMAPLCAIIDPAATLETPMELMLSTGMRAMDHAVEHWCSVKAHPLTDGLSVQAMEMLASGLPAVKARPDDLDARLACQMASWLTQVGGTHLVPNGASHGIGYILGGYLGIPHGITSCISLWATLQWNEPVNAERQRVVAEKLGRPGARPSTALREFVKSLGLPTTLQEIGISADRIPELARQYKGTGPISTNPRPVKSADDLAEILRIAA